MSPRRSKTGSRSTHRTRGTSRSSKSPGRGSSHARSLSSSRHSSSNSRGGASTRSGASTRGAASTRRRAPEVRGISARSKRSRGSSSASYAVKLLQQDHRAVAEALAEFESAGWEEKQAIARRICKMLIVHSQIEEELMYPAARDALHPEDEHLVAEALVEHASLKDLIGQIEDREEVDEQYEAKVCVLGEYVKHHVSKEESEIFPRLERSPLDLEALGERLEERKSELMDEEEERIPTAHRMHEEELESVMPSSRSRGGRGHHRSTGLHARRR